jgi:hypothetical protein
MAQPLLTQGIALIVITFTPANMEWSHTQHNILQWFWLPGSGTSDGGREGIPLSIQNKPVFTSNSLKLPEPSPSPTQFLYQYKLSNISLFFLKFRNWLHLFLYKALVLPGKSILYSYFCGMLPPNSSLTQLPHSARRVSGEEL